MQAISINNLSKTFRTRKWGKVEALRDLTLSIEPGEIFGFLGPNGAGKSTTIKTLMGLITPTTGSAELSGIPVCDAACRAKVGYLPENPAFYDFLTAREYLAFVAAMFDMSRGSVTSATEHVLDLMELTAAADRPIRGFSKGMVQRLGLAQAMLHDPDIYILDEPMSGLDPLGRALVKNIIKGLKAQGKTVFFSTHITADVEVVCDRVGVIANGRLQAVNEVRDILIRGIEGYHLQIGGISNFASEGVSVSKRGVTTLELYVQRDDLSRVLEQLKMAGGDIILIEPQRKSLENFFLDVVAGAIDK
ncbi:ABC transporter ATP-binding protein [Geobacter sulfurreducens]|uniref:ABC transporter ATP-binding protein n=1 Tax=Geobacter sulfurreducens TaxID=35554 RepID=UPI001BDD84AD|nr:ABC transporter ATP-binding protein [Geobacter sulfurreducens]QVW36674.1 ABC transporter ATP-binding protein [Geobacter sulfurreducens]